MRVGRGVPLLYTSLVQLLNEERIQKEGGPCGRSYKENVKISIAKVACLGQIATLLIKKISYTKCNNIF
jgi:hypothetical protein